MWQGHLCHRFWDTVLTSTGKAAELARPMPPPNDRETISEEDMLLKDGISRLASALHFAGA